MKRIKAAIPKGRFLLVPEEASDGVDCGVGGVCGAGDEVGAGAGVAAFLTFGVYYVDIERITANVLCFYIHNIKRDLHLVDWRLRVGSALLFRSPEARSRLFGRFSSTPSMSTDEAIVLPIP